MPTAPGADATFLELVTKADTMKAEAEQRLRRGESPCPTADSILSAILETIRCRSPIEAAKVVENYSLTEVAEALYAIVPTPEELIEDTTDSERLLDSISLYGAYVGNVLNRGVYDFQTPVDSYLVETVRSTVVAALLDDVYLKNDSLSTRQILEAFDMNSDGLSLPVNTNSRRRGLEVTEPPPRWLTMHPDVAGKIFAGETDMNVYYDLSMQQDYRPITDDILDDFSKYPLLSFAAYMKQVRGVAPLSSTAVAKAVGFNSISDGIAYMSRWWHPLIEGYDL